MKQIPDISDNKFCSLLNKVIRLRLFCNTNEEMGEYIGYNLIQNNLKGIRPFIAQCIFHELEHEIQTNWDRSLDLEEIMLDYKNTSSFYETQIKNKKKLDNERTITEIVKYYCIDSYKFQEDDAFLRSVIKKIREEKNSISIPILLLVMLKILPSFTSKKGDVKNNGINFNILMTFLKKLARENSFIHEPIFIDQIEQKAKRKGEYSRLSLIFAAIWGMESFRCLVNPEDLYNANSERIRVEPDIVDQIWVESDKRNSPTVFWVFSQTANQSFFLYKYRLQTDQEGRKKLLFTCYEAIFFEDSTMFIVHPNYIQWLTKGVIPPNSQSAFSYDFDDYKNPQTIELHSLTNNNWLFEKNEFVYLDDTELANYYRQLIMSDTFAKQNKYPESEYSFSIMPMAITPNFIYIEDETEEEQKRFYRIPRKVNPGLNSITVNDGGILRQGGRLYVGFESLCLFFEVTSDEDLLKYDINIVDQIKM
jgi:hypothetical protein